jgi:hypothetical protein
MKHCIAGAVLRGVLCLPVVFLGAMVLSAPALAQTTIGARCRNDCLDATRARERVEWARSCALQRNVGDPTTFLLINPEDVSAGFPANYDYTEIDTGKNPGGQSTYSGNANSYRANEAYVSSLYEASGSIIQTRDTSGYFKWTKSSTRLRTLPLYPTFGSTASLNDASNAQLYRNPNSSTDCTLYSDAAATTPAPAFFVNGYCDPTCATQGVTQAGASQAAQPAPASTSGVESPR